MPSPEKPKRDNPEKRAKAERAFIDALDKLQRAVGIYEQRHPQSRVDQSIIEAMRLVKFDELDRMDEAEKQGLMRGLLKLHQDLLGEPYEARLNATMVGVTEITMALDTLSGILGFRQHFEQQARQKLERERKEDDAREFYNACLRLKPYLPAWRPATHPSRVLFATNEQKIDFADSLARAAMQTAEAGAKASVVQSAIALLRRLDGDGNLGLQARYPALYERVTTMVKDQMERQAQRKEREDKRFEARGKEVDAVLDVLYKDILSISTIGPRYAAARSDDDEAQGNIANELNRLLLDRIQHYPPAIDILRDLAQEGGQERALHSVLSQMIKRLQRDYPTQKPQKKGWTLPWNRPKESPVVGPDLSRIGEEIVGAAVKTLALQYKNHPDWVSLGEHSRAISEMALAMVSNPKTIEFLRSKLQLAPHTSPTDIQSAVRKYFYQELKRQGLNP